MKKTLIAAVCAAFVSTGAFAGPSPKQHTPSHNRSHVVEQHVKKPPIVAVKHHNPKPVHVAKHHPKPVPHIVHHHHNHLDLGDALIAFAILATAAIN